jgi:hypothetical protein
LRRQGRNIFEINDEVWTQDGVLLANASDRCHDLVSSAPEPNTFEGDRPREEGRRHQVLGPSLLGEDPTVQTSGRWPLVLGPALIAGVLLLGAGVLFNRAPEGSRVQAKVEPTSPRLQLAPAAPTPRKTERQSRQGATRARDSAVPSSSSARPRSLRARGAPQGSHSPRLVRRAAPTRPPQPGEKLPLGREFGFER